MLKTHSKLISILLTVALIASMFCIAFISSSAAEGGAVIVSGEGEEGTPTEAATDPESTDPESTDPQSTDPESTDPVSTDPGSTDPVSTDPGATDPGSTDPGATDPGSTDPGATDPGSTDPIATDPGGTTTGATLKYDGKVYDKEIHVEDVITYTYTLKAGEKIGNIQAVLKYSKNLELIGQLNSEIAGSSDDWSDIEAAYPVIGSDMISNTDIEGEINFNASSTKGYDFSNGDVLVTVKFKVISEGDVNVSLRIDELNSTNDTPYISDNSTGDEAELNSSVDVECPHEQETTEPTDPIVTDPDITDPNTTDPNSTDPNSTDPNSTDPNSTDPNSTDGSQTGSNPTQSPNATSAIISGGSSGNNTIKTGDNLSTFALLIVLTTAAGALFFIRKKIED